MGNYYFEFIFSTDIFLLSFSFFLSVSIIVYVIIRDWLEKRRMLHLGRLISGLEELSSRESREMAESCPLIIKNTAPTVFFDLFKRQKDLSAGNFLEQFRNCLNNSGKTKELEKIAKYSWDKWKRIEAILMVGLLKSENAHAILKETTHSADEDIFYFSILSLGSIKTPESAKLLLSLIKKNPASGPKIASILETFPDTITGLLIEAIRDSDKNLRFWSLKVLSRFKQGYLKEIGSLTKDKSADIRAAVCECLGQSGQKESAQAIRECLKDDAWFVRLHAIRALENILGDDSITEIAPFLKDNHWFIRENVKEVMSRHFTPAQNFFNQLSGQDDEQLRLAYFEIMEKAGFSRQGPAHERQ